MKKARITFALTLAALLLLMMTACGTTDPVIKLGDQEIPTLFSVVGERKITKSSAQISVGVRYVEKTYAKGAVSEDDLITYLDHLVKEEGYTALVHNLDGDSLQSISGSSLLAQLTKDADDNYLAVEIYNTEEDAILIFYGLRPEPWNADR